MAHRHQGSASPISVCPSELTWVEPGVTAKGHLRHHCSFALHELLLPVLFTSNEVSGRRREERWQPVLGKPAVTMQAPRQQGEGNQNGMNLQDPLTVDYLHQTGLSSSWTVSLSSSSPSPVQGQKRWHQMISTSRGVLPSVSCHLGDLWATELDFMEEVGCIGSSLCWRQGLM